MSDILFNNNAGTCVTEIAAGGVLVRVRLVVTMYSVLTFWVRWTYMAVSKSYHRSLAVSNSIVFIIGSLEKSDIG